MSPEQGSPRAADFLSPRAPQVRGADRVPSEEAKDAAEAQFKAEADRAMGGTVGEETPKAPEGPSEADIEAAKASLEARFRGETMPVVMSDETPEARTIAFVEIEGFAPTKFYAGQTREWLSKKDERGDPVTVERIEFDKPKGLVHVYARSIESTYNGQCQEIVAPLSKCTLVWDHAMPATLPVDMVEVGGNLKPVSLLDEKDKQQVIKAEAAKAAKLRTLQLEAANV